MTGHPVPDATQPPAVSVFPTTLRKRSDFLRAAKGKRASATGFLLQAHDRADGDRTMRVGFTCSKKVGNAVARNRAKRRLREIARAVLPAHGKAGFDYVLVGRFEKTAERDFAKLLDDLHRALKTVHG